LELLSVRWHAYCQTVSCHQREQQVLPGKMNMGREKTWMSYFSQKFEKFLALEAGRCV
jgi:hypothetical protein